MLVDSANLRLGCSPGLPAVPSQVVTGAGQAASLCVTISMRPLVEVARGPALTAQELGQPGSGDPPSRMCEELDLSLLLRADE